MQGSIRKRGDKWYYAFEMAGEGGKRKRVERVGGRTKAETQKALREALADYEKTGQVFQPSKMSFSDFLDFWLENYALNNCKYNTMITYQSIINEHIKLNLGHFRLSALSPAILQDFINARYKEGYSVHTMNLMKNILFTSLKYAVFPSQYIKENPAQYVKIPKIKQEQGYNVAPNKVITKEQFEQILKIIEPCCRIPYLISYYTGCRRGEVLALTWNDINFTTQEISINKTIIPKKGNRIYFGTTKTASSVRKIKIGSFLLDILKKHKIKQMEDKIKHGKYYINYEENLNTREIIENPKGKLNLVCTVANGKYVSGGKISYSMRKISKKLNIPFTFHYIRHTCATKLIESGVNPKAVQSLLGHSNISTTMDIYTQSTEEMANQVVNALENKNYLPTII